MEGNTDEPKAIHTYQTDIEDAVKREGISRAQIFVADQKKKEEEIMEKLKPRSSGFSFNLRSLVFAILFLIAGGIGIYYFLRTSPADIVPPPKVATTPEEAMVSYDSYISSPFPEEGKAFLVNLINENKLKIHSPGVTVISFEVPTEKFLSIMAPSMVGLFSRSLDSEFAFGLIGGNNVADLAKSFLILKVNTYSSARGSLLSAENNVANELASVFDIPNDPGLRFRDKIIDNRDIRVLVDSNNRVYFLYSFIDSNTLVFAEDDDTFKIIVDRIYAARRQ